MFCSTRYILLPNVLCLGIQSYSMVQTSYATNATNGINNELGNIMKYVLRVAVWLENDLKYLLDKTIYLNIHLNIIMYLSSIINL